MGGCCSCWPSLEAEMLVVGAGPAGIAAVLALRETGRRVLWVDPAFESGRLSRFTTVPCNTKVDMLVGPGTFNHPLMHQVQATVSPAVQRLVDTAEPLPTCIDPAKLGFTTLGACKDVFDAATAGLVSAGVPTFRGKVTKLSRQAGGWVATLEGKRGTCEVKAKHVVLATGCEPKTAAGPKALCVEETFQEEQLRGRLAPSQRVAVLGNSHSAAIALARLRDLAGPLGLRVACFARRPIRIAEWVTEHNVHRYNSTGLKGYGSVFGAECMVNGADWLQIRHAKEFDEKDWDWVVDCTGYKQSPLPEIVGSKVEPRDEATGALAPSLFGLGVPWGEAPGRLWGKGLEDQPGFKGEDTFVGFAMFLSRAVVIAEEIGRQMPAN